MTLPGPKRHLWRLAMMPLFGVALYLLSADYSWLYAQSGQLRQQLAIASESQEPLAGDTALIQAYAAELNSLGRMPIVVRRQALKRLYNGLLRELKSLNDDPTTHAWVEAQALAISNLLSERGFSPTFQIRVIELLKAWHKEGIGHEGGLRRVGQLGVLAQIVRDGGAPAQMQALITLKLLSEERNAQGEFTQEAQGIRQQIDSLVGKSGESMALDTISRNSSNGHARLNAVLMLQNVAKDSTYTNQQSAKAQLMALVENGDCEKILKNTDINRNLKDKIVEIMRWAKEARPDLATKIDAQLQNSGYETSVVTTEPPQKAAEMPAEEPTKVGKVVEVLTLDQVLMRFRQGALPDLNNETEKLLFMIYISANYADPSQVDLEKSLKEVGGAIKEHPGINKEPLADSRVSTTITTYDPSAEAEAVYQQLRNLMTDLSNPESGYWESWVPEARQQLWERAHKKALAINAADAQHQEASGVELPTIQSWAKQNANSLVLWQALAQAALQSSADPQTQSLQNKLVADLVYTFGFTHATLSDGFQSTRDGSRQVRILRQVLRDEPKEFCQLIQLEKQPAPEDCSFDWVRLNQQVESAHTKLANPQSKQENFEVRHLSLTESPLRSCLGIDCSSRTYLLKALAPAYHYFTLTYADGTSIGHVTVVLGVADSPGGKVNIAFVDKVQNIADELIGPTLEAVRQATAAHGYQLAIPKDLGNHNGISNLDGTRHHIRNNLETYTQSKSLVTNFQPHADPYEYENEHSRAEQGLECVVLLPRVAEAGEIELKVRETAQQLPPGLDLEAILKKTYELRTSGDITDKLRYVAIMRLLMLNPMSKEYVEPDIAQHLEALYTENAADKSSNRLRREILLFHLQMMPTHTSWHHDELKKLFAIDPGNFINNLQNLLQTPRYSRFAQNWIANNLDRLTESLFAAEKAERRWLSSLLMVKQVKKATRYELVFRMIWGSDFMRLALEANNSDILRGVLRLLDVEPPNKATVTELLALLARKSGEHTAPDEIRDFKLAEVILSKEKMQRLGATHSQAELLEAFPQLAYVHLLGKEGSKVWLRYIGEYDRLIDLHDEPGDAQKRNELTIRLVENMCAIIPNAALQVGILLQIEQSHSYTSPVAQRARELIMQHEVPVILEAATQAEQMEQSTTLILEEVARLHPEELSKVEETLQRLKERYVTSLHNNNDVFIVGGRLRVNPAVEGWEYLETVAKSGLGVEGSEFNTLLLANLQASNSRAPDLSMHHMLMERDVSNFFRSRRIGHFGIEISQQEAAAIVQDVGMHRYGSSISRHPLSHLLQIERQLQVMLHRIDSNTDQLSHEMLDTFLKEALAELGGHHMIIGGNTTLPYHQISGTQRAYREFIEDYIATLQLELLSRRQAALTEMIRSLDNLSESERAERNPKIAELLQQFDADCKRYLPKRRGEKGSGGAQALLDAIRTGDNSRLPVSGTRFATVMHIETPKKPEVVEELRVAIAKPAEPAKPTGSGPRASKEGGFLINPAAALLDWLTPQRKPNRPDSTDEQRPRITEEEIAPEILAPILDANMPPEVATFMQESMRLLPHVAEEKRPQFLEEITHAAKEYHDNLKINQGFALSSFRFHMAIALRDAMFGHATLKEGVAHLLNPLSHMDYALFGAVLTAENKLVDRMFKWSPLKPMGRTQWIVKHGVNMAAAMWIMSLVRDVLANPDDIDGAWDRHFNSMALRDNSLAALEFAAARKIASPTLKWLVIEARYLNNLRKIKRAEQLATAAATAATGVGAPAAATLLIEEGIEDFAVFSLQLVFDWMIMPVLDGAMMSRNMTLAHQKAGGSIYLTDAIGVPNALWQMHEAFRSSRDYILKDYIKDLSEYAGPRQKQIDEDVRAFKQSIREQWQLYQYQNSAQLLPLTSEQKNAIALKQYSYAQDDDERESAMGPVEKELVSFDTMSELAAQLLMHEIESEGITSDTVKERPAVAWDMLIGNIRASNLLNADETIESLAGVTASALHETQAWPLLRAQMKLTDSEARCVESMPYPTQERLHEVLNWIFLNRNQFYAQYPVAEIADARIENPAMTDACRAVELEGESLMGVSNPYPWHSMMPVFIRLARTLDERNQRLNNQDWQFVSAHQPLIRGLLGNMDNPDISSIEKSADNLYECNYRHQSLAEFIIIPKTVGESYAYEKAYFTRLKSLLSCAIDPSKIKHFQPILDAALDKMLKVVDEERRAQQANLSSFPSN